SMASDQCPQPPQRGFGAAGLEGGAAALAGTATFFFGASTFSGFFPANAKRTPTTRHMRPVPHKPFPLSRAAPGRERVGPRSLLFRSRFLPGRLLTRGSRGFGRAARDGLVPRCEALVGGP